MDYNYDNLLQSTVLGNQFLNDSHKNIKRIKPKNKKPDYVFRKESSKKKNMTPPHRATFLICDSLEQCFSDNHILVSCRIKIDVVNNKESSEKIIIGYYCNDCGAYYIKPTSIKTLQTIGKIRCPVIKRVTFDEKKEYNDDELTPNSFLYLSGYSAEIEKTSIRHKILSDVLESGLYSKKDVINTINDLINCENQDNIERLKIDLLFLQK